MHRSVKWDLVTEETDREIQDYQTYIRKNKEAISKFKDQILDILKSLRRDGVNVERDVYPQIEHLEYYAPELVDGAEKDWAS